jgi:hypothetical protein
MSERPGTDGPSAYTTGVTDGTVTWKYLIGNNFMLDVDYGFFNVWIKRYDCRGPCVRPVLMRKSNGAEQRPTGFTISGGRIEQPLFGPLFEDGARVRWFNPDISRVWADQGIIVADTAGGDIQIHGGKVELAFGAGLFIDGDDVYVQGTKVLNCSQEGGTVHHGVVVGNNDNGVRLIGLMVDGSLHNHAIGVSSSATNTVVAGCYVPNAAIGGIDPGTGTTTLIGNTGLSEQYRPRLPGEKFGGFLVGAATLDSASRWVLVGTAASFNVTLGTTGVADGDLRTIENRATNNHTESVTGQTLTTGFGYTFRRNAGAWQIRDRFILS